MIERVILNLEEYNHFVFIINDSDPNVSELFSTVKRFGDVVFTGPTDGPARTVLKASYYIDSKEIIVTNCDQIIYDFRSNDIKKFSNKKNADGVLGAFLSESPKNSYMKIKDSLVTEIKEKEVISQIATNGLHYWKNGYDLVESIEEMIKNEDRVNGEFYIAPSYNYLIKKGRRVMPFFYNMHYPVGTPEDLKEYEGL